jgi:pimeloyl-ACP methyl ester carboxylesterase
VPSTQKEVIMPLIRIAPPTQSSDSGGTTPAIELDFESYGNTGDPTVLLVMGLGTQRTAWPRELMDALTDRGFRVVTFDNRDVGLSTRLSALGLPKVPWEMMKATLGLRINAPYTLADMAQDALALMDSLHIAKAHVVGASMGGMIAQLMAVQAPARVLSLTSIMSTTGRRGLPGPSARVRRHMLTRPPAGASVDQLVTYFSTTFRLIGTPQSTETDEQIREKLHASVTRSYYPVGTMRQLLAVVADGSRVDRLKQLAVPTLVVHGTADPLVPYACGKDTAAVIPGAQLVSIQGMGHDFAPEPLKLLVPAVAGFISAHKTAAP